MVVPDVAVVKSGRFEHRVQPTPERILSLCDPLVVAYDRLDRLVFAGKKAAFKLTECCYFYYATGVSPVLSC